MIPGVHPEDARENLLIAVESLFDLLYLIGEARDQPIPLTATTQDGWKLLEASPKHQVLSQFHRISDSLGDYGMIRVALWLHPCPSADRARPAPKRAIWIVRFGLHGREASAAAKQFERRARQGSRICHLMLTAAG